LYLPIGREAELVIAAVLFCAERHGRIVKLTTHKANANRLFSMCGSAIGGYPEV
jgi:hypothetical protein